MKKWNPNIEVSTESLFLGFVSVNEADQKGTGSVLHDLLLKGGTVNKENIGLWTVALDYRLHRNYVFGDTKTLENVAAFATSLSKRNIFLEELSMQAEVVRKALDTVMAMPGDWHT